MRTHVVLHRLAIIFFVAHAALNIVAIIRARHGALAGSELTIIGGLAFWGFLGWKIWTRPKTWGFGVGILFLTLFPAHIYLWHRSLATSLPEELGASRSPWAFLASETPYLGAAICSLGLR